MSASLVRHVVVALRSDMSKRFPLPTLERDLRDLASACAPFLESGTERARDLARFLLSLGGCAVEQAGRGLWSAADWDLERAEWAAEALEMQAEPEGGA